MVRQRISRTSARPTERASSRCIRSYPSCRTSRLRKTSFLGNEAPSRGGVVDWVRLRRVVREQLKRLDQEHIPVNKMAGGLTPVQQTMVAIARAIAVKARVLIMDEPTAALTDLEIKSLFNILRKPRDEGVAIIYVSHRLEEVFALCDRATIMRNGQVITTSKVEDITIDEVISTMVGRSLQKQFPDRGRHGDKIVVELKNLFGRRVHDVSLIVSRRRSARDWRPRGVRPTPTTSPSRTDQRDIMD